jgi:hypothetical protein
MTQLQLIEDGHEIGTVYRIQSGWLVDSRYCSNKGDGIELDSSFGGIWVVKPWNSADEAIAAVLSAYHAARPAIVA